MKEGEVLASWLWAPFTGRCRGIGLCVNPSCVCLSEVETQLQGSVPTHPSTHLRGWRGEASPSVLPSLLLEGLPPAYLERQVCMEVPEGGLAASGFSPVCKVTFHRCSEIQLLSLHEINNGAHLI